MKTSIFSKKPAQSQNESRDSLKLSESKNLPNTKFIKNSKISTQSPRLYAEWEKQRAILLALPHKYSDWKSILKEVRVCFERIIKAICVRERVYLCIDSRDKSGLKFIQQHCKKQLKSGNLQVFRILLNDTWVRDFGPISIQQNGCNENLNFIFNGWGLKFSANFDNQVNTRLHEFGILENLSRQSLVLEGGSIDSNGEGLLLTTTNCLLEPNRNAHLSKAEIEKILCETFGLKKIFWLEHGFLAGDDTDSHIDNLARFIAPKTIAYVKCEDSKDIHFENLAKMEDELKALRDESGAPFKLVPLPLPKPQFYKKERLPASYVNFLFVNGALLVPTYNDKKNDKRALEALRAELPHLEVLGIDCTTLIKWHGSLHCASMQLY